MKQQIASIPILGGILRQGYRLIRGNNSQPFPGSANYWEQRYAAGGNSGSGSYNKLAEFKAEVLNAFVEKHEVKTVIEFGCGDGNQLSLANYPRYTGFDVSQTALNTCIERYAGDNTKTFKLVQDIGDESADLTLSLDVIYHLIEDQIFYDYMQCLFNASNRYVIVYASDSEDNQGYEGTHVKHRKFTKWIETHQPEWKLLEHIPNKYPYKGDHRTGSFAEFYIYEKNEP